MSVRVYDLGHSRAGDKGNTSNVSVIAYDEPSWRILRRYLTATKVMDAYRHMAAGPITRYDLPKIRALNFVIEGALGGGVTRSLRQDMHGKSLSTLILTIELDRDADDHPDDDWGVGVARVDGAGLDGATSSAPAAPPSQACGPSAPHLIRGPDLRQCSSPNEQRANACG